MSAVRPLPPPKPHGFSAFSTAFPLKSDVAAAAPPTDSDTDSGICADSDQSSPRQQPSPRNTAPPSLNRNDYLTPNSARRLLEQQHSQPRRTLPPRPFTSQSSVTTLNRKPQFRVRFADEVDSGASTSSSSDSPRIETTFAPTKAINLVNNNNYAQIEQRRYDSLPRIGGRRPGYSVDDVESLPDPPSYAVAVQHLRNQPLPPRESVRDSVIRHNVENTLRNRSSSLPRGVRGMDLSSFYSDYGNGGGHKGSVDNLYGNYEDNTVRRRRLPPAPLLRQETDITERISSGIRQPALMRQRRFRAPPAPLSRRSASVGRYPDTYVDALDYNYEAEPAVRAQLVALDQRGFRTVLVEKTQPGPFGFYIATGVMHGQRGIFISRVSLPSLTPMLSVGDEILYVDDELVKGRSLEYVQSLISGKTAVAIVLLPTVGALC